METLPGSCTECKFGERYGCVGDVKCKILGEYFTGNTEPPYKERPDACPLEEKDNEERKMNVVTVRWFDGYLEEFEATEVRFGSDIIFLRLAGGKNRHIPLRNVRWFGMTIESHQRDGGMSK